MAARATRWPARWAGRALLLAAAGAAFSGVAAQNEPPPPQLLTRPAGEAQATPAPAPPQSQAVAPATQPAAAPSTTPSPAPAASTAQPVSRDFSLQGSQDWVDTGIDVGAGDKVTATGDGSLQYPGGQQGFESCGPEGLARGWKDLLRALPVNAAGRGALIGRVGSDDAAVAFLIGGHKEVVATRPGRLFLGINQLTNEPGEGTYKVKLQVVRAKQAAGGSTVAVKVPAGFLESLPRRVSDSDGRAGDMVNLLIIGPADKLEEAFQAAAWVQVDKSHGEAVVHGILATLNKEAYVQMPMSELYLFGRAQDYGWARAEPIQVVASRNHLRIWKSTEVIGGQPVWVGAATHDIGFEKDQRNGGITHKIDPNVDDEREFVGQTLNATGMIAAVDHVLPPNPVSQASTATGGSFHSDGRLLVLVLR